MNKTIKSILLWLFAFLFTVAIAIYQRKTGPSYPISGSVKIENATIGYQLIRTYDGSDDAKVRINVADTAVSGEIRYRRFRSYDSWHTAPMARAGDTLIAAIPNQPAAGKVMYHITLIKGSTRYVLNNDPTIIRYKGFVPMFVLIPHIITIFLAMMFSTLTGVTIIFKGKGAYTYAWWTVVMLLFGGLILGPIVQKYAFDAYWTGWPFGHDLTDNKSLVAFIFWVIALIVLHKNRENKIWPIVAAIVLLIVFLIPHSVLGSEIDFTKEQQTELPADQ
jgi:hypothetical protein